jgi:hypothetical protein
MKVLVIPDVHLKPELFDRADELLKADIAERAVCLMDLADDFGQEYNILLYERTYDRAIRFQKDHPDTLWCYGNHDLSYKWDVFDHPGFSRAAHDIVCEYLEKLDATGNLAIMHRIDNAVFSHAGLTREFVDSYLSEYSDDIDAMIEAVNDMGYDVLWDDTSPVWARPQQYYYDGDVVPAEYLNVVGHTPVRDIIQQGNLLTVDTFSTWSDGRPFGNSKLCRVDTVTKEWGYCN